MGKNRGRGRRCQPKGTVHKKKKNNNNNNKNNTKVPRKKSNTSLCNQVPDLPYEIWNIIIGHTGPMTTKESCDLRLVNKYFCDAIGMIPYDLKKHRIEDKYLDIVEAQPTIGERMDTYQKLKVNEKETIDKLSLDLCHYCGNHYHHCECCRDDFYRQDDHCECCGSTRFVDYIAGRYVCNRCHNNCQEDEVRYEYRGANQSYPRNNWMDTKRFRNAYPRNDWSWSDEDRYECGRFNKSYPRNNWSDNNGFRNTHPRNNWSWTDENDEPWFGHEEE